MPAKPAYFAQVIKIVMEQGVLKPVMGSRPGDETLPIY